MTKIDRKKAFTLPQAVFNYIALEEMSRP